MFRLLLFLILFIHSTTFAMPKTMPLANVQEGMSGKAYTVVDSSGELESFDVKIIGTVYNGKGSATYIMAQASGDLIERTKGVLQGMSGSPVYVDGKLIGALSAGLKEMDPTIFLITPIENMTKLWDLPDQFAISPGEEIIDDEENLDVEEILDEETFDVEKIITEENPDTEIIDEEKSFFVYNGFDSAGLDFLKSSIPVFKDMTPASVDDLLKVKTNAELYGGAPFGVAVVYGDFVVGATGTVTAVDEKKVVGFGHSFTHAGNSNFFMTDAKVIAPVTGANGGGMKMATLGNIIGRINQDRESGIGGILGQFPSVVPISVTVNGETYNALIAYNENLIAKLGAAIAYSALSKNADSLAESTVKVSFDINTNVVDGDTLSRENIYYSPTDVGQLAITELLSALTLITTNTTEESNIWGIDVKMDYTFDRMTANLIKAEPVKKLVKPGETVDIKITLQPYRKPAEEIIVQYTVPITAKEGKFMLDMHGGGLVPIAQVQTTSGVIVPSTKTPSELYNEKISNLLKTNKNNEIIIKPTVITRTEKELKAEIKRVQKLLKQLKKTGQQTPTSQAPTTIPTNYIIENVIQCTLNVDKL